MRHVVAIADEGEFEAAHIAEAFLQSEDIGQGLARMEAVAERVDHRDARPVRQIVDGLLRKYARDDGVGPAVEIAGDVFQRLAIADGAGGEYGITAELLDREFKRKASAERRLFKQKRDVAARESLRKTAGT